MSPVSLWKAKARKLILSQVSESLSVFQLSSLKAMHVSLSLNIVVIT